MPPWNTYEFKQLQKLWYRRLKKAGFEDAEKFRGGQLVLKISSRVLPDDSAKAEYYRQLALHVQNATFDTKIERLVMEYRAEGYRIKDIVELLEKKRLGRHRQTIRHIINKYEAKWKLRK